MILCLPHAIEQVYSLFIAGQPLLPGEYPKDFALISGSRPAEGASEVPRWLAMNHGEALWQERLLERLARQLECPQPAVAWRSVGPDQIVALAFPRTHGATRLTPEELDFLAQLEPYIARASSMREHLRARDWVLDSLADGIIFTDCHGRISFVNESARSLLSNPHSPAFSDHGVLRLLDAALDQTLHTAIADAGRPLHRRGQDVELAVYSSDRAHPYRLRVNALHEEPAFAKHEADVCAVISISDPNRELGNIACWLQSAYQLTPTEARVAMMLAEGRSSEIVAELLGVRPSTVKSHLKSIFCKMGIRRQCDLIRVITLSSGAGLRIRNLRMKKNSHQGGVLVRNATAGFALRNHLEQIHEFDSDTLPNRAEQPDSALSGVDLDSEPCTHASHKRITATFAEFMAATANHRPWKEPECGIDMVLAECRFCLSTLSWANNLMGRSRTRLLPSSSSQ